MTNLGMKIVGEELEAGFTVSSRAEFDWAVARLSVIVATLWPGKIEPDPSPTDIEKVYANVAIAQEKGIPAAQAAWRESQGLR